MRQKRQLIEAHAAQQQQQLTQCENEAEARRSALAKHAQTSLTNAEIRYDLAQRQYNEANDYYNRHPNMLNGQPNINAAELVANGKQHTQELTAEIERLRQALKRATVAINTDLETHEQEVRTENERALQSDIKRLQQQLSRDAAQAAPHGQPRDAELGTPAPATPAPLLMPAIPAGKVVMHNHQLAAGIRTANLAHLRDSFAALQVIDDVRGRLRNERQDLLANMKLDVEDTARSLAAEHGYRLTFVARRGVNLTTDMHQWLHEIWPLTRKSGD